MKESNVEFLQLHIHHWHTLRDEGYIKVVDLAIATGLLRIAQEEFDTRYQLALHHPQNVCALLQYVYTQFELYLEREKAVPLLPEGLPEELQFNKAKEPAVATTCKPARRQTPAMAKKRLGKFVPFKKQGLLYGFGASGGAGARPPPGGRVGNLLQAKALRRSKES